MERSFIEYVMRMRNGVTPELKDIRNEAEKTDRTINDLKSSVLGFVGFVGLSYGARQLMRYGAELTKVEKSFEVLVGNKGEAESLLASVSEYAKNTNFGKMGLAQSAKDLLTYGVNAGEVMPTLRMLGDIALGDQEKLKLLSYAYAQVQGAGKLMGQDLLQLINSGFNPLQIMAEKTGISMGELRDMMRDGAISADMVTEAMRIATSEGGRFFNGAMALADTGAGRYDRMNETALETAQIFGQDLLEGARPVFDLMTSMFELIQNNLPLFEVLGGILGSAVAGYLAYAGALKVAAVAQALLNGAMLLNPIGLVIAGIAALVAGVAIAYHKFDKFREIVDGVWSVIKGFGQAIWSFIQEPIRKATEFVQDIIDKFKGFFSLIKRGAQALGLKFDIDLSPNPGGFLSTVKGLYDKGVQDSRLRTAAKKEAKESGLMDSAAGAFGLGGGEFGDLKSGIDSISGRAPKTFNINIQRMTGIETLNTTNIREGLDNLEEQIRRVLLNALNDSQNLATS